MLSQSLKMLFGVVNLHHSFGLSCLLANHSLSKTAVLFCYFHQVYENARELLDASVSTVVAGITRALSVIYMLTGFCFSFDWLYSLPISATTTAFELQLCLFFRTVRKLSDTNPREEILCSLVYDHSCGTDPRCPEDP